MNFVPCVTWIPQGVAKSIPDKIQLTEEELEAIINKTKEELNDEREEIGDTDEDLMSDGEENVNISESKPKIKVEDCEEEGSLKSDEEVSKEKSDDDDLAEYDFDKYDDEEAEPDALLGLANLAVYASASADPYVTLKYDKDDDDSEKDNFEIKSTDNLLVVCRIQDDASILEINVFNEEEESFYVHHDIILSYFPLCLEWLNYDPGDSNAGNLVAVGSMEPIIEVWDMDVVDCLEPAYKLGKKARLKKNKSGYGHSDAVLDLSWNSNFPHVLASGSADKSIILWDLESGKIASSMPVFQEKVQTLSWHPFEAQTLLSGSSDMSVRVFDCRANNSYIKWDFPGEIERVIWNHFDPFCYLASTDLGSVHYVDCRSAKPIWQLKAHSKEVTGLCLSPQCPGMLITTSADRSAKVWDIAPQEGTAGESTSKPVFISEMEDFGIGVIQCAAFCPDSPFVMCSGGDKKSNNLRVWHAAENSAVRKRFFTRELRKVEKLSSTTTLPENEAGSSVPKGSSTLSSMETENAVSAMESMSLSKNSKKHDNKRKIKKKRKPRFKS